ncbi:hypothetical protein EIM50_20865, partial [Pseudoxanthomonas sp. SGD-10]
ENIYQHQNAATSYLKAKDYYLAEKGSIEVGKCYLKAAYNYHTIQKFDVAMDNYRQSMAIYKKLHPSRELSLIYSNIGVIYDYNGDYSNAMWYYVKSYELDKKLEDTASLPIHYNNIGQVFTSLKIYKKALTYLNKSVDYAVMLKDSLMLGYAYVGLNNVHLKMGNIDTALTYVQEAIQTHNQIGIKDYELLSIAYTDLARVYIRKKDYEKARQALSTSYAIADRENLVYPKLYSLAYTAKLQNCLRNFSEAEVTVKKALELYDGHRMIPIKTTILNQLKEAYAQQSRFDLAYKIQEEIYSLNQNNTYENHVKNISEIAARMDFSQEKEISDLKNNRQQNILRNKIVQQKVIIVFAVLLLICLSVLAFVSIRNHKTQKIINNTLLQKNTEIEANRKEINKQSRALSRLNEHKDIIFTIISHDLRRPIGHLSSILELLENNIIDEQEMKSLIPQISKSVRNTSQILDSLLVWAKSQLKGFSLKLTEKQLFTFINEKIEPLMPFAIEKNISIVNNINPSLTVKLDALLATIIIRNLVLNAIKFSNESQSVEITADSDDSFHYITVKDKGIGMDEEQLKSLFGPQTKSTLGTKKEKGTGLGL